MTEEDQKIFQQLPKPGKKLLFKLVKVEDICLPHPYCITPKHLAYADSMYLNETTIAGAETHGAKCDICRQLVKQGKQNEVLPLSQHEKQKTLFIEVVDNRNLNKVRGLHQYLLKIKPLAAAAGIQGFAFPKKNGGGL